MMEDGVPIRVLVIDDEESIRRFLRASLESNGYRVIEATTGTEGIRQIATVQPDAVLLDLGLPDMDGVELITKVREWSSVPIVVLSARSQEDDKVHALESGADDYLTKPFGVRELLSRLKVSLRRQSKQLTEKESPVFRSGTLEVDFSKRLVTHKNATVHLTPIEYRLLCSLIRYSGKVVTHRQLLTEVWGPQNARDTHYLRIYMKNLREKLEDDPLQPRLFVTEPGIGYRFNEDGPDESD